MDKTLQNAIREATRNAFTSVRNTYPNEHFYYFALVTTEDALRPGPCSCSIESLERLVSNYRDSGIEAELADLRWSEADSPYNLEGDEYFDKVEELFLKDEDHRDLPDTEYLREVLRRYEAMEGALRELDKEGYLGVGEERYGVLINIVAPGDKDENAIYERAEHLNPPESLKQLKKDFFGE